MGLVIRLAPRFLLLVLLTAILGFSTPASAQYPPPECEGTDLLAGLGERDPAAFAAVERAGRNVPNSEGLLWRIEKAGRPPSHLFGTIHVTDPRATILPSPALEAIAASRLVVVEPIEAAGDALPPSDALPANAHATRDELGSLKPDDRKLALLLLAERGIPPKAAGRFQPWFLAVLVSVPPCEAARAELGLLNVDQSVVQAGRKAGASIRGLETQAEQLEALSTVSSALALQLVVDTARLGPAAQDFTETMIALYAGRRIGYLFAAFDQARIGGDAMATQARYLAALLGPRNQLMHDRMQPFLDEGGAFVAVGALHLVGEDGLVARLRQSGYTLTRVL